MNDATRPDGDGQRLFLRVDEAAGMLGISRSLAYQLAKQWIESGGETGIPAIRLGRRLLVNRSTLTRWAEDTTALGRAAGS
jgi:excisionase family DNA binding protein